MLFNSLSFAIFLPIVFAGYWMLSRSYKAQNLFLLLASYFFYGWWDARYLLLIFGCSIVNFLGGMVIYSSERRFIRRLTLTLCCVTSLGTLGVFKYYNFFVESFETMFAAVGIHWSPIILDLALPVGISFFTFQALSYAIDIAFGNLKPTRNVIEFLVFISFFPQLVAGPIERAKNLLPQFQKPRTFCYESAVHGTCLIAYGLFKKMVVADSLGQYVDMVWSNPTFYSSAACAIGVVFFSIQIYCDFSGYSDIARGVARLLGFQLMVNFDRPYLSQTFSEFWRRWHISLSSWFKDYVYIPLGGSRAGGAKLIRNLWIVFLLSGLWHGASWAFVAWGALHACYLTLGVVKTKMIGKSKNDGLFHRLLSIIVIDIGVAVAWIPFRSGTLSKSIDFLRSLLCFHGDWTVSSVFGGASMINISFCCIAILGLGLSYLCPRDCNFRTTTQSFIFSCGCVMLIVFLGMPVGGEFIYFKF